MKMYHWLEIKEHANLCNGGTSSSTTGFLAEPKTQTETLSSVATFEGSVGMIFFLHFFKLIMASQLAAGVL